MKTGEYILCAAINFKRLKGYIFPVFNPINIEDSRTVICGYRHSNCFENASYIGLEKKDYIQGFLTSYNRFVSREEAREIALASKQIESTQHKTLLFSEDLY